MSGADLAGRLERARARLGELDLQALLVTHTPNLRYLTGFTGSSGWLLLGSSRAIFATDGRYQRQAEEELAPDLGFELVVLSDGILAELAKLAAQQFEGPRVGFEAQHLSYADWQRLVEAGRGAEWVAVHGVVEDLRAVKDEAEIDAVASAGRIAVQALQETLPLITPGVREAEIAAELDYRMSRLGAEGPAFATIVASGPRTALPHASTGQRRIRAGDLLLCDFGARWRGYCSDLTRTFVVGAPTARQAEVYRLVLAAQRAACQRLRAGASGAEVDAAAREEFAAGGLEDHFPHSTGHGLGLEVHEAPRLYRRSEEPLRSNMVVTVEPGLYFPGWGGIRIEDDFVVTEGAPRVLADLDKVELRALPP